MADGVPDLNSGVLAPLADEVTLWDLPVVGELPTELCGTLVRNGPNPFDGRFNVDPATDPMLEWWVAPAMVHGLAIGAGRARWYRNRWVHTAAWARHQGQTPIDHRDGPSPEQNPNVSLLAHRGSVFALGEGGLPFLLSEELDTLGPAAIASGDAPIAMTAHPKLDSVTGELCFFRADWQAPYLRYGVLGPDGRQLVDEVVDTAAPAMMHDFAVTATRSLFLDLNVAYDFELLAHGAPIPLRWHEERVSRIGLIDRAGG